MVLNKFYLLLLSLMLITSVSALEINPILTPNGTTSNTSINVQYNISAPEGLTEIIYNFNNTNYSLYDSSLVLFYNFDNRSSLGENDTHVKDLSRYGNNGTKYGMNFQQGKYGNALYMDAFLVATKNLTIKHSASLTIYNQMSVSFWLNVSKGPYNWEDILSKTAVSGNSFDFYISANGGLSLKKTFNNGTGYVVQDNGPVIILNDSAFHQYTIVYNLSNRSVYYYRDGIYNAWVSLSALFIDNVTTTGDVLLSDSNATIDNLMIYNRSLSSSEVNDLYRLQIDKYDLENWSYKLSNQSINQSILNSSNQQEIYNYKLILKNSTSILSGTQQTITRIIKSVSNIFTFNNLIGNVYPYFYGANVHNSYLANGVTIDTNNDGTKETTSNVTWHREMFLDAGLKFAREDMGLGNYYVGFCDSGYEYWYNTSAITNSTNDGITFLPCVSDQGFANSITSFSRSTDAHSGSYSINVTSINLTSDGTSGSTGSHHSIFFGQVEKLYLQVGHTYNYSVWLKGNGSVRLIIQNADTFAEGGTTITLNNSWVQYSHSLNVSYYATKGYRLVIDNINGTDWFLLDDLNLTNDGVDMHNTWWRLPSATINTTKLDEYQWARANNVKTINVISYTPPFLKNLTITWCDLTSTKGTGVCPPINYDVFGQVVTDYVNWTTNNGEYLDVVEYEVWNEPDISFWLSALATDHISKSYEYIKLYNASYTKIKEKYPNAIIFGTGAAGIYRYNMTNTYLSNLTDEERNKTISYHRYAPSYAQSKYIGNYLVNDTLDVISRCLANGASCVRFILDEWNIYGGGYLENNSMKLSSDFSNGYIRILNTFPSSTSLPIYQWSEQYLYNNTAYYPEYPSKWHMVLEPALGGGDIRPQYNVTYMFARYCAANSGVYNSSTDDSEVLTLSCKIDNTESIIIVNTANEARNVTITTSGLKQLIDVEAGTLYDVSDNSANLGLLDPNEDFYLTEPIVTLGDGIYIYSNYFGEELAQYASGQGTGSPCDSTTLAGYQLILIFSALAIVASSIWFGFKDGWEDINLQKIIIMGIALIVGVILFQASADNLAIGACS